LDRQVLVNVATGSQSVGAADTESDIESEWCLINEYRSPIFVNEFSVDRNLLICHIPRNFHYERQGTGKWSRSNLAPASASHHDFAVVSDCVVGENNLHLNCHNRLRKMLKLITTTI
jgi:hypothetical protein